MMSLSCPAGSFYLNITGLSSNFPIGYVPHGDQHLRGEGVFTFNNGGTMDWTMNLTSSRYAVTQAHLYKLPEVPNGDSWACWGGRWTDHAYLQGTGFDDLYGITAQDIAQGGWVVMLHTEGGHFAVDGATGNLVVYDETMHETSVTGQTESGERFNNRVPRKLTNRFLREINPVSGPGDKTYPLASYFERNHAEPFPDANDNVWITWDATSQKYVPSAYGMSKGLTQANIDTVEYLFYRYDDQGPEWDWGGPEGAGGGVLVPCPASPGVASVTGKTPVAPAAVPAPAGSSTTAGSPGKKDKKNMSKKA